MPRQRRRPTRSRALASAGPVWAGVVGVGLVFAGVVLPGCGPVGFRQQLAGAWVGVPETAEERAERTRVTTTPKEGGSQQQVAGDPERPAAAGPGLAGSASAGRKTAASTTAAPPRRSDLEAFDVQVSLELQLSGEAAMWVGEDRDQALRGSWRVVSGERSRAILEITVNRGAEAPAEISNAESAGSGGGQAVEEKRRFVVQLLDDGNAFTLVEENADRMFGALYFRRQDEQP